MAIGMIDELKAMTSVGVMRPHRYKVSFQPPAALIDKYTADEMRLIEAYTFSVGIPAANYLSFDWVSKGVPIKLPYQKNFSDLITNHYIDERNVVRRFLQDWYNLVMDESTNDFNYLKEYTGTVIIKQYDQTSVDEGSEIAIWTMDNCWPTILGQEQLSYDSNDQILAFDVTWAFNILVLNRA